MPTVLRIGPYRFFFYSADGSEPPHIHVEKESKVAKYWLNPIRLQENHGLNRSDLSKITAIIEENQQNILEAWNDYFND